MSSSTKSKEKKCGLIMPISSIDGYPVSHWEAVLAIIKEALSDTEFYVELVSDADEIGVIQKRIVQNIYDNEIVVCDVSAKNPNVMFELGMRLAFDKPAIIIKDDKTNYSFDTGQIEHLEYPRELNYHAIQAFKLKLRDKVVATFEASKRPDYTTFLKHFGHFVVADIEEKKVSKDSYILEAVSELRKEVISLRRTLHQRIDGAGFNGQVKILDVTNCLDGDDKVSAKTENEMIGFMRDYLGGMIDIHALAIARKPDSESFNNMFQAYLQSKLAPSGADIDFLRNSFVKAASKLKYF
jgi:hypothetical protein